MVTECKVVTCNWLGCWATDGKTHAVQANAVGLMS